MKRYSGLEYLKNNKCDTGCLSKKVRAMITVFRYLKDCLIRCLVLYVEATVIVGVGVWGPSKVYISV